MILAERVITHADGISVIIPPIIIQSDLTKITKLTINKGLLAISPLDFWVCFMGGEK